MRVYLDNMKLPFDEIESLQYIPGKEFEYEFFSQTKNQLRESDIAYNNIELLTGWKLYAHLKDSEVWNDDSFEELWSFVTLYELWDSFKDVNTIVDDEYLYYLVRDGIGPSESNTEHTHLWWITFSQETIGDETSALNAWLNIMLSIVGQTIFKDHEKYEDVINMMSVTKKKYTKGNRQTEYIFKIYVNMDVSDRNLYQKINLGNGNVLDFSVNGKFLENKREDKPRIKRNNQGYRKIKK